ncbi:MAG: HlyU family transcriptional regulator [Acidimicrobiia bacterium]
MLGKFLHDLFSPGSRASETRRAEASVEYKGYTITPAPEKGSAGWRVAGTISKEISGRRRVHQLDRADASPNREAIVAMTIEKAKRVIDEQGDRIFGDA